jgi:hypothetical protein
MTQKNRLRKRTHVPILDLVDDDPVDKTVGGRVPPTQYSPDGPDIHDWTERCVTSRNPRNPEPLMFTEGLYGRTD